MTARRFAALCALILVIICIIVLALVMKDKLVLRRSLPSNWAEIDKLTASYPYLFYQGKRQKIRNALTPHQDGFGSFMYVLLIDPMPKYGFDGDYIRNAVSEDVHKHFAVLAEACSEESDFGSAMRLLFKHQEVLRHTIGVTVPFNASRSARSEEITPAVRADFALAARKMQSVINSQTTSRKVKAAAHLVMALIMNSSPEAKSTISGPELEKIPNLYPEEHLTCFLSQYYLFRAQQNRRKFAAVAKRIDNEYGGDASLRDLGAYEYIDSAAKSTP